MKQPSRKQICPTALPAPALQENADWGKYLKWAVAIAILAIAIALMRDLLIMRKIKKEYSEDGESAPLLEMKRPEFPEIKSEDLP